MSNTITISNTTGLSAGDITVTADNNCGSSAPSILTLTVLAKPTLQITGNLSVCLGTATSLTASGANSYAWNNGISNGVSFTPTATNTYTVTGTGANGCTATKSATVTVKPLPNVTVSGNTSVCFGQSTTLTASGASSYSWTGGITNGVSFTPSATASYTVTGNGSNGCSKSVTVTVKVKPTTTHLTTASICQGQSYTFNGGAYFIAGNYFVILTNYLGCDSTDYLALQVKPNTTHTTSITICQGQSVVFNGHTYNSPLIDTDHLTNYLGCDSTDILILNVNPTSTHTTTTTICQGQSVTFNGNTLTTNGIYYDTLANYLGCDSIEVLVLNVNPTSTHTTTTAICDGQTVTFNGNDYATSGTYTDHFTNYLGCDSTDILVLQVNPASSNTTNTFICQGNSVVFNGNTYSTAGTYTDHLTNYLGCDSTDVLVLNINSSFSDVIDNFICQGDSFLWNGIYYHSTISFVDTFTNQSGCDSIWGVNVIVLPTSSHTTTASICQGQSYTFNGTDYNTGGTYTVHLANYLGCDSTDFLVLNINPSTTNTTTVSICQGQSYSFNGNNYTSSIAQTDHLTNQYGCDSIDVLVLTVNPTSTHTTTATICQGQSYLFNGNNYSMAANIQAYSTTETLGLQAWAGELGHDFDVPSGGGVFINQLGAFDHQQNGITGTQAGGSVRVAIFNRTTQSVVPGLDVLIAGSADPLVNGHRMRTITPVLLPPGQYAVVAKGYSSIEMNGGGPSYGNGVSTVNNGGGIINFVGSSRFGANNPTGFSYPTTPDYNVALYFAPTFNFSGNGVGTTITHTDHLTNQYGCDSTDILVLNVNPTTTHITTTTICQGGSVMFNGNTYTSSITHTDHLTNQYGCDSTDILVLNVNPISTHTTTTTICQGQSYNFNGNTITTNGIYYDTLANYLGCDSIAILVLNVNPTSSHTTTTTICQGGSVVFNGNTYMSSTTHTDHLTNQYGCDSSDVLVLIVNPLSTNTTTTTICQGGSVTFNGNILSTSGIYYDTLANYLGCDSIEVLVLHVNPTSSHTTTTSICQGQSITFNGTTYTASTTHTDHLTNQYGCDSTDILVLIVNPTSSHTTTASICQGQSFTFNGTTYTSSTTHTDHLTNYLGCDSTDVLLLIVNPTSNHTTTASICQGQSFTFNGTTYTQTTTHTDHLTNHYGCDSTDVLVLIVKPNSTHTTTASICSNQTFTFNGNTYNTTGTHTDHLTNYRGCDSTDILVLNVTPTVTPSLIIASASPNGTTVCANEAVLFFLSIITNGGTTPTYIWKKNGTPVSTATTYGPVTVANGDVITCVMNSNAPCASAASITSNSLTMTVNPVVVPTISVTASPSNTICSGTQVNFTATITNGGTSPTYQWFWGTGAVGTNSPTYSNSALANGNQVKCRLTSNAVCASPNPITSNIITMNVTASTTPTIAITANPGTTICAGTSVTFNSTITNGGTTPAYQWKVNGTPAGTNSNSFTSTSLSNTNVVSCVLTSNKTCVTSTTANSNNLTMTVKQPSAATINTSICQGQSYSVGQNTFTASGTYTIHLTNHVGCDSAVTLNLIVNPTSTHTTTVTICSNQSYTWNGSVYNTAGTQTVHLTNYHGCDSTDILVLKVNPTSSYTTTQTICSNQTYTWNGSAYNTAGSYSVTLTNYLGCDSTDNLILNVNPTTNGSTTVTICSTQTYTWNGTAYNTAGTYSATLTNQYGCDSTDNLILNVNPTTNGSTTATICSNQTYTWNGTAYNTAGTYSVTLTNQYGCDSTDNLILNVNPTTNGSTTATICSNQTYTWNGTAYNTAGTYSATLTNQYGCDSTDNLILNVNPTTNGSTTATICSNQTYTWNGTAYNVAGTYGATLTNQYGCDSTDNLTLFVNPTTNGSTTATICGGSTYTWNGTAYNTSGTYSATLTNHFGCDSTDVLVLNVNAILTHTVTASICSNQTYSFGGINYNISGIYRDTFITSSGCDSVEILQLTVRPTSTHTTTTAVCQGFTYTWNGTPRGTAGTFTETLTNYLGCDSTDVLVLIVNPNPVVTVNSNSPVCAGSSAILTASGATTYNWDGGISNGVSFIPSGTTTYTVIGTDGNGCKDTVASTVVVLPLAVQPGAIAGNISTSNTATETYTISTAANATSYIWAVPSSWTIVSGQGSTSITVTVGAFGGNIYVVSHNTCGNSAASTLAVAVSCKPVMTLSAATNTGFTVGINGQGGPYRIYYRQIGLSTYSSVVTTGTALTTSYTFPNPALVSNTTYAVYVEVVGSPACGSSVSYITTTGTNVCSAPPVGLSVVINCQTATVTWTAGAFLNYIVSIHRVLPTVNLATSTVSGTTAIITTADPTNNVTYEVSVKGKCSNGLYTAYAFPLVFTINASNLSAITGLTVNSFTCNTLTASWNPDPHATNGYQIILQKVGTTGNSYPSLLTAVTFTGLTPGATYNISVKSKGCNGTQGPSSPVVTQTLPTICSIRMANVVDSNTIQITDAPALNTHLSIYPNPNNGNFMLEMKKEGGNELATIQLINVVGQVVYEDKVQIENGDLRKRIEALNLISGNYILKVISGSDVNVTKVQIQTDK